MTKREFLASLEEILEEPPGKLTGSESLQKDLKGWNSLTVLSFIAMVDEYFNVTLSAKQIADCATVNDLMGLLADRISE
jgi:acyl carrier protein